MKNDIHVAVIRDGTLSPAGRQVKTLCGLDIESAQIHAIWDDLTTGVRLEIPSETVLMCRKCLRKAFWHEEGSRVKVWAVTEKRTESTQRRQG